MKPEKIKEQLSLLQDLANKTGIDGMVFIRFVLNQSPLYGFESYKPKKIIKSSFDYNELRSFLQTLIERKKRGDRNAEKLKDKYPKNQMLKKEANKLIEKLSPEIAKILGVESAGISYAFADKSVYGRSFYLTNLNCRRLRKRIMLGGCRDSVIAKAKEISKGVLPACYPAWYEEEGR